MTWQIEFADWLRRGGRSEKTVAAYAQDARLFAAWFEAETGQAFEPAFLNGPDLRAWREHSLHRERVSAATWNRRRISLKLLCRWAVETRKVAADPFEGVKPARAEQPPILWLDDREFAALRRTVERRVNAAQSAAKRLDAIRDRALIALMLYAGLRVSEALAVQVEDVEIGERSGAVHVTTAAGKGEKERRVPLNAEARRALRAWMDASGIESGRLFGITARTAQRRVREIGAEAGVSTPLTPHRLRHTFVKRVLDGRYSRDGQLVALSVARRLAGHASIGVTARYAEPSVNELAAAVGG